MKILRRISDHLCAERGLSIVENPQKSRGSYRDWQDKQEPQTNKDKLRDFLDAALQNAKDYDAFIAAMIARDCEVKRGKYLAFRVPGAERFTRCKSLGEEYTEDAIRERLTGRRTVTPRVVPEGFVPFVITRETKFGLLIDIQKKVQEGKGEAYEQWAKVYNIKQMAALQKQIAVYGKTREVYKAYLRSGRDRDYRERKEQHRQLFTARDNLERLFGIHRDAPARTPERRQISRER